MANKVKEINGRLILKHDTGDNWLKATNFIPKQGEIIIYDIDSTHTYERVKVGDGNTVVSSLPFIDDNKVDKIEGKGLSTNDYTTEDKNKLAGIAAGANKTVVDTVLSSTSENPVQNKVVDAALKTLIGDTPVADQISEAIADYYTKSQIDSYELITLDDIDEICGEMTAAELPESQIDTLMAKIK
jgi:hypothetical protein